MDALEVTSGVMGGGVREGGGEGGEGFGEGVAAY